VAHNGPEGSVHWYIYLETAPLESASASKAHNYGKETRGKILNRSINSLRLKTRIICKLDAAI